MGATGSRSSPATETLLVRIEEYSKLMRAPVPYQRRNFIRFGDLLWDITVSSMRLNEEETGVSGSESDFLVVGVFIGVQHSLDRPRPSALGIDISIEILDHNCLYTVFHSESSRGTMEEAAGCLLLGVRRNELEASSCVRRDNDDCFFVRCTLKRQPRPPSLLLGNWFSSKPTVLEKVAMARCHTLTVGSLAAIKAALLTSECAHSARFAVGGSRWYLKFYPWLAAVCLVRATKEDDKTRTTAEFSFALEGAVNVQSEKMTHTFDRDKPDCAFTYQLPPEEAGTSSTDRLVVRCCVKVIPPVVPSPATTIPSAALRAGISPAPAIPDDESVLTPLLSAMHG